MSSSQAERMQEALGRHAPDFEDVDLIKIMRRCEVENQESLAELRPYWQRSYRAYHSRHFENSKYFKEQYRARSKLFRPKTRSTVIKNMATAAAALFSTQDVISVQAEYGDDEVMLGSAKVINELVNYRLDRTSRRGGIPWFRIAMGANFNAQITGICASKQYWDYQAVTVYDRKTAPVRETIQYVDPETGEELSYEQQKLDGNGDPVMEEYEEPREMILADRPWIELLPPEHCWLDLRAHWVDPAQRGSYFIIRYPMSVGDFKAMMASNDSLKSPIEWLEIDDKDLKACVNDYDAHGVRQERKGRPGTSDRFTDKSDAPADDFRIIWVHENFMRFGGIDYCWWSIGTRAMASKVAYTHEVYPHAHGQRPVSYGVAAIEPHITAPQSPVEALQPLQQEMNDLANLRLDAVKQQVEPVTKIKKGSIFDVRQLRQRGAAGANLMVRNMEDLEYMQPPGPSSQSYAEMDRLNADFDDVGGVFSGSSVSTNRQLNETVGGMRMLSGAANATTEYHLRVWSETWVEPTIRQVVQLEQYYETDEIVLAICGKRAGALKRYNIDEITDSLLESEVMVSVNVGMGSVDPVQKLQKLATGLGMLANAAPFADRQVKINMEELIAEVMGAAGYKDGMRFFEIGEPGQEKPDPEMMKLELQKASEQLRAQTDLMLADKNNAADMEQERVQQMGELMRLFIGEQFQEQNMRQEAMNAASAASQDRVERLFTGQAQRQHQERMSRQKPNGKR